MKEVLLVCLAGGVCALDTTAAWQVMLSQPLVSASIAGLLTGAPATGAAVGVLLQMLWSGSIPVGARPMPDAPVASVSGVWFASALLDCRPDFPVPLAQIAGVAAALGVALVGRETIMLERELNRRLFARFLTRLKTGRVGDPGGVQLAGAALAFSRGFALCLVAIGLLTALTGPACRLAPPAACTGAHATVLVGALGVGVLFNTFVRRSRTRLAAFAGGLVFAFLLRDVLG
ncbi:MAG: PTS sugar transporter subunit IIC [Candidatus Eisenbacteria bacterium]|nr:PTS sugar transporter subunit IIC [Candidatus Eisenbacteria bacterium]